MLAEFSVWEVATLHSDIWIAHDLRDFRRLEESAVQMATEIGFSESERISGLIKDCYFLHSLLDDCKYSQIAKIFCFEVRNRKEAEKLIFRDLETKFKEIHTLSKTTYLSNRQNFRQSGGIIFPARIYQNIFA
ncbi:hypothetical protein [Archaeoglobus sp.]